MRKAKVVCTIGPACNDYQSLKKMIMAGMDIARINTSHSSENEVIQVVERIRKAAGELKTNTAIMLDLQGPKIRVGDLKENVVVKRGESIKLTTKDVKKVYDPQKGIIINVGYKEFIDDISRGNTVFIDDGLIELKVTGISKSRSMATCEVIRGGIIKPNKGINLPGVKVSLDSVTEKDYYFLQLGIKLDVDLIAQSFVRDKEDVAKIKERIKKNKSHQMVIAKIEKHEAIDSFEGILREADAIMIARGDLGIEIDEEDVPLLQKKIIKDTNHEGKPVITATQMLDSMIRNHRPTRAEVSDVANAILDGSDAIMLSGETAIGKYPLESLQMMVKIINKTEQEPAYSPVAGNFSQEEPESITQAISSASCEVAHKLHAKAIVSSTKSGHTARQVSKNRPRSIIIGASPHDYVVRQLMASWGVVPLKTEFVDNINEIVEEAMKVARINGFAKKGDVVVITAGVNKPGSTNMINVRKIE
ncbi:MAG: pyruvate kinase [Actinomycetota bacterium]